MMQVKYWAEGDQGVVEILGHAGRRNDQASREPLVLRIHEHASWSDVAMALEVARDRAKELASRDYDARCRHEAPPLVRDEPKPEGAPRSLRGSGWTLGDLKRYLKRKFGVRP